MKHLLALITALLLTPAFSEAAQLVHQYVAQGNAQLSQHEIVLGSRLNSDNTLIVVESLIPKERLGVIYGLRVSKIDLISKTSEIIFEQPSTTTDELTQKI